MINHFFSASIIMFLESYFLGFTNLLWANEYLGSFWYIVPTLVQLNCFKRDNLGELKAFSDGTIRKKLGKFSFVNIGWVSA